MSKIEKWLSVGFVYSIMNRAAECMKFQNVTATFKGMQAHMNCLNTVL